MYYFVIHSIVFDVGLKYTHRSEIPMGKILLPHVCALLRVGFVYNTLVTLFKGLLHEKESSLRALNIEKQTSLRAPKKPTTKSSKLNERGRIVSLPAVLSLISRYFIPTAYQLKRVC